MLDHYWILPFTLMFLCWLIFKMALRFFTRFLDMPVSSNQVYWFSTLLFLAYCSVLFEMSSFFYWMSGSITYMPSFILFILLVQLLLFMFSGEQKKWLHFLAAVSLVFCICGTNEIALYFLLIFLIWCQSLYYSVERKSSRILWVCLTTALLCLVLLILPSGISHRAGNYRLNFPVFQAWVVSLGYSVRIIFWAVSSPFSWIMMATAIFAGFHTKESIKEKISGKILLDPLLIFTVLFAAVLFFYFMIYLFSGELLAPRAHNLTMAFAFSVILFCFYSYGLQVKKPFSAKENFSRYGIAPLFLLLVMISSLFMRETLYNAFTGIVYNRVMQERDSAIQSARRENRHSVVMYPYSQQFASQGKKILPPFIYGILRKKMMNYPDWMHFQDPVQDTALYIHYYAEYHHIDTIRFQGVDYERIGLMIK
jgi:hypothetical protein